MRAESNQVREGNGCRLQRRRKKDSFCFVIIEVELIFCYPCFYIICACTEFFLKVVISLRGVDFWSSCVSHFNVSLIAWAKSQDSVHKSHFLKRKERRAEADRTKILLLSSALLLGHTGSPSAQAGFQPLMWGSGTGWCFDGVRSCCCIGFRLCFPPGCFCLLFSITSDSCCWVLVRAFRVV